MATQTFTQKSMQKFLEVHGWRRTKGGKHVVKMEKAGCRPITLPMHRGQVYSKSLSTGILRQAGLKDEGDESN